MNRTMTRSLILSMCGLTLLGFAFALFLRAKQPQYKGERQLSGLNDNVEVFFDKWAIPHIQAKSEKDAYHALGFLHAQERLFQMEMMRRLAKGELAEILGEKALKYDKFFRTVGIKRVAKKLARKYLNGNSTSTAFQAYLDGINEFIKTGSMPVEFLALGIEPKLFEASDSFAIAGYMSFSFFKGLQTDPLLNFLDQELPPEFKKDILPPELPEQASFSKEEPKWDDVAIFASNFFKETFNYFDGSNAWVISGKRTRSGKAILANDPHIGFSAPSVWFEAVVEYPGFQLYGHYLAGVPVALLGHSETHGWGLTMLQNKDSDFYQETVNPENPSQFWFKDHWEEMSSFVEEFKVKGEKDLQIDVKVTRHGPVMNDVIDGFKEVKDPIAFRWSFADEENRVMEALYDLAFADTVEKAASAVEKIHAPGLNVLYANEKGDIAWWAAAKFPIRKADSEGRFILDGSSGEDEYLGYHPFSSNPSAINPEEGFIASANHNPFPGHPYKVAGYYNPDYRINKLNELLSKKESWTVDDNKELQLHTGNDSYYRIIEEWIPILDHSETMNTELKQAAFTLLKSWDLQHPIESVGATIFHEVYGRIVEKVFQERLPEAIFEALKGTNLIHDAILQIIRNENSSWWLDKKDGLSKREEWIRLAWNEGIQSLEERLGKKPLKWDWGRVHTVTHKHAFGASSKFLSFFNVGPYAMSGSTETLLNANFKLSSGLHEVYYGPSTRRIIDFVNPSESWGISPTGQSGYFANSHYQDQTAMYLQGEYRIQTLDKSLLKKPKHLLLVPKR